MALLNAALRQPSERRRHPRPRPAASRIELVADRATKAPFDPALAMHQRAKAEAFARGLLIYPGGGTVDGRAGDHILLAPPYNVTR